MAQLQPTTATVAPTSGEIWYNLPIDPDSIQRAYATDVKITTVDLNLYPAIRFDLKDGMQQYWIYALGDTATRDADLATVNAAIAPPPSGGGGEANTASNVGAGVGVFKQKTGLDLEFKSLVAGSNVSLVSGTNTITINASSGASTIFTNQNANYLASAGDYVNMTTGATDKTVTLPAVPVKDNIIDVTKADSAKGRVIIDGNTFNINGSASALIKKQYTSLTLQFDGVQWRIK